MQNPLSHAPLVGHRLVLFPLALQLVVVIESQLGDSVGHCTANACNRVENPVHRTFHRKRRGRAGGVRLEP